MSKHIITKSKMIVDGYVDAAGIGRRLFILPGEKLLVYLNCREKSAEVILTVGNEPVPFMEQHGRSHKTAKASHIKLFQML